MKFFVDKKPARDEYAGRNTIGIFIGDYCLLGLYYWHAQKVSYQSGLIVFNHLFGAWWGKDAPQ